MALRHALETAFARLSPRERRLVALFGLLAAAAILWVAVIEPLVAGRARLRQGITALERDMQAMQSLAERIRELKAELGSASASTADDQFSLFSFVDRATATTIEPDAVASMSPSRRRIRDGYEETTVEIKLNGVTLPEIVNFLQATKAARQPVYIKSLEMKRRYQDPARFDAVIVIAALNRT